MSTRLLHRQPSAEAARLTPASPANRAVRPAKPAAHLKGLRRIDHTPLNFDDLLDDADTCPEWAVPATVDENVAAILAAVAAAPFVRHEDAVTVMLEPIQENLAELPAAENWLYYLEAGEAHEIDSCLAWRAATTNELDRWYNAAMLGVWAVTGEVIHPARELRDGLVLDVADSIRAEVTL